MEADVMGIIRSQVRQAVLSCHVEVSLEGVSIVTVSLRNTNNSAVTIQKVKSVEPSSVAMRKCPIYQPGCAMQCPRMPRRRYACGRVHRYRQHAEHNSVHCCQTEGQVRRAVHCCHVRVSVVAVNLRNASQSIVTMQKFNSCHCAWLCSEVSMEYFHPLSLHFSGHRQNRCNIL